MVGYLKQLKIILFNIVVTVCLVACNGGEKQSNNNQGDMDKRKSECEQCCKKNMIAWIEADSIPQNYINTIKYSKNRKINGNKDCDIRFPDGDVKWTACRMLVSNMYIIDISDALINLLQSGIDAHRLYTYDACIRTCN